MQPEAASRSRDRAILLLMVGSFATGANIRLVDTVLPQVADEFSVTVGLAAQIATAYALGYGAMQILLGIAGDRFGKIRLVATLCFASVIACLLAAVAQSLGQLTLARLLCGAATSAIVPISLAWVGDMLPYEERPMVMARYASGGIFGMVSGQIAGGLLTEFWDWRAGLVLVAALYLVAGAGLVVAMRGSTVIAARPQQAQARLSAPRALAAMLKRRWSRIVLASVFLEGVSIFASITFVGVDLRTRFDASYAVIGVMLAFFAVGGFIFTLTVRRLVKRFTQPQLVCMGAISAAMGLAGFAAAPALAVVPPALMLVGFGAYMVHSTLQTFATQLLPEARATGFSVFATLYFLSQSVGVALAALVIDRAGSTPIFVVSACVALVFGLWFLSRGKIAVAAQAPATA